MKLGQGPHGSALKQGIHQSVAEGFKAVAAAADGGGLKVGTGDARMGGQGLQLTALLPQPGIELKSEHHVGQLALAVGAVALISLLPGQIIPADPAEILGSRGHGHHPSATAQQWQQLLGEGHVPQVVHGELQFMALLALSVGRRHHPGVVEQQIQMAVALLNRGSGSGDAVEIGQVQIDQIQACEPLFQQSVSGGFRSAAASAGHQHRGTLRCQSANRFQAEADVRACDQGNATLLGGDVVHCPAHGESVFRKEQFREFVGVHVIDAGQTCFDGAGHFPGKKTHGIQSILSDVIGEKFVFAFKLLVVDHRHHPALVGVDQIGEFEFGIVQIQGHVGEQPVNPV